MDTTVAGELNLKTLLRDMKPEMQESSFVFCTIARDEEIPDRHSTSQCGGVRRRGPRSPT
ncbi:ACT domain-containing protein [Bradyrhizobium sp. Leo121]|uniref:ACT domain-containing protein n=1 Tax=Bradyrhizobium sp. Leo121 TaxID=1571195 RepID=UPI001028E05A|nr:ACT domain-containing protein [Bradyrhizobium sp. Leo121]RZN20760.1 hypothetical protein CWO90_33970 [Bradyrhizobium sp. Leo121]